MSALVDRLQQRLSSRRPARAPGHLRAAAVLVPIILSEEGDRETLLLTRRSDQLRRQPGDISFPGGAVESTDATPLEAALRESEEEVGIACGDVTVLGQMDERGTVTGFRITPFVGVIRGPYPFATNEEVESLIHAPVRELARPEALRVEQRKMPGGQLRDVYHYDFDGHDIWGITGRLVKEFLELSMAD